MGLKGEEVRVEAKFSHLFPGKTHMWFSKFVRFARFSKIKRPRPPTEVHTKPGNFEKNLEKTK